MVCQALERRSTLTEYFMRLAGIKIQVVPFRGGNQALTDLLGKRSTS